MIRPLEMKGRAGGAGMGNYEESGLLLAHTEFYKGDVRRESNPSGIISCAITISGEFLDRAASRNPGVLTTRLKKSLLRHWKNIRITPAQVRGKTELHIFLLNQREELRRGSTLVLLQETFHRELTLIGQHLQRVYSRWSIGEKRGGERL